MSIFSFPGSIILKHEYSHYKQDFWLRISEAKIWDDLTFRRFQARERVRRGQLANGLDQENLLNIFGLSS